MDPKDTDFYKTLVAFGVELECCPSWEEIRQVEYVRQRGEINMITENVARWCLDHGLYECAEWIVRCQDHKKFWGGIYDKVYKSFEVAHGPREKWISRSFKDRIEEQELTLEIALAEQKLRELKGKRKSK